MLERQIIELPFFQGQTDPKEAKRIRQRRWQRASRARWTPEKKRAEYEKQKKWRDKNPDYQKRWNAAHPEATRGKRLKCIYGITIQDYDRMLVAQSGGCAICGLSAAGLPKNLYVDHDHATGRVRGLLCDRCNRGMGYFKDSPARLEAAAAYLKKAGGGGA